jgi:hypothetical protein
MKRMSSMHYYRMVAECVGPDARADVSVTTMIELNEIIEELQEQVTRLTAQIETARRAAESDEAK